MQLFLSCIMKIYASFILELISSEVIKYANQNQQFMNCPNSLVKHIQRKVLPISSHCQAAVSPVLFLISFLIVLISLNSTHYIDLAHPLQVTSSANRFAACISFLISCVTALISLNSTHSINFAHPLQLILLSKGYLRSSLFKTSSFPICCAKSTVTADNLVWALRVCGTGNTDHLTEPPRTGFFSPFFLSPSFLPTEVSENLAALFYFIVFFYSFSLFFFCVSLGFSCSKSVFLSPHVLLPGFLVGHRGALSCQRAAPYKILRSQRKHPSRPHRRLMTSPAVEAGGWYSPSRKKRPPSQRIRKCLWGFGILDAAYTQLELKKMTDCVQEGKIRVSRYDQYLFRIFIKVNDDLHENSYPPGNQIDTRREMAAQLRLIAGCSRMVTSFFISLISLLEAESFHLVRDRNKLPGSLVTPQDGVIKQTKLSWIVQSETVGRDYLINVTFLSSRSVILGMTIRPFSPHYMALRKVTIMTYKQHYTFDDSSFSCHNNQRIQSRGGCLFGWDSFFFKASSQPVNSVGMPIVLAPAYMSQIRGCLTWRRPAKPADTGIEYTDKASACRWNKPQKDLNGPDEPHNLFRRLRKH
ncbi:putative signal peptide protein [Puccinia sorghi]|uniref:Putative signal peptide protein n=1 Tax=Puccinia sorghi TaxID=27349 RepID=A0A0L6VSQ2_9BASI|nr:putative signal peptide protein [Puccinia sorghi]